MDSEKNTMCYKGKGRDSSPVYKANVLQIYFIMQNTTCFYRVISVLSDICLIVFSILKNDYAS